MYRLYLKQKDILDYGVSFLRGVWDEVGTWVTRVRDV